MNKVHAPLRYGATGLAKLPSVSKIQGGTLKTYWADQPDDWYTDPALYVPDDRIIYHPPVLWPTVGKVLSLPMAVRFAPRMGSATIPAVSPPYAPGVLWNGSIASFVLYWMIEIANNPTVYFPNQPNLFITFTGNGLTWLETLVPVDYNADFLGTDVLNMVFTDRSLSPRDATIEAAAMNNFKLAYPKFRRVTTSVYYPYLGTFDPDDDMGYNPTSIVTAMTDYDFHMAGFGPFVGNLDPTSPANAAFGTFLVNEIKTHFGI